MKNDVAIAFFGAFGPDEAEFRNAATSTAGNLFQLNMLDAWTKSALPQPDVFSYCPTPSFPTSKRLFSRGRSVGLPNGLRVKLLPFINLGALKILTLGLSSCLAAIGWGLRNRGKARRIVIVYNLTAPPARPLLWACRLANMELVPFIGDIYVPGEVVKDTWLRRLEFRVQTGLIPKVEHLMVCNSAIIEDFAPSRKAMLIEGGVPEAYLSKFEGGRSDGGPFRIVYAGALTELNGIPLLLEALRICKTSDLQVTIMGKGPCADAIKWAAQIDPRIKFLGGVPHEEVLEQYRNADLLISLRRTHFETQRYVFPSKVVECLATGRPLLTTCTGHVRANFGDFVFLLEEETPEALAAKLTELAEMPREALVARGHLAQEYVREHKTWESHMRRLDLYLSDEGSARTETAA